MICAMSHHALLKDVTGGDAQRGAAKGSDFWAFASKGSHFQAGRNQNVERVHTFGKISQRVRTLGTALPKTKKGFALLCRS